MNSSKLILALCIVGLSSATLASARCHSSCSSSCSPCTTTRTVRYYRPAPCFSFSWGFPSLFCNDDYEVVTYRRPCRSVCEPCCSPCVKRVRYVTYDDCDDYCW